MILNENDMNLKTESKSKVESKIKSKINSCETTF